MSQHFSEFDFANIENQDELKSYTQSISFTIFQISTKDEKSLKQVINELLNKVSNQITNPVAPPKSKFMSLMMMKEFTEKHTLAERKEDKNSKLFSILSSHTLLKEMKNIAELNDPMKQIQDKGKNIFPQNSSIGNDYIRITLQLIKYWASRFPATSKKQPTSYKKFYDELASKKVIFPNQYKFLAFANKKGIDESDTNRYKSGAPQEEAGASLAQPQTGRSTIKAQIYHMYNRLLNFVESLDEEASAVEPQIRTIHSQIKNEVKRYESMQAEMGQMIEKDNVTFTKYISVLQFMHKELQYHQQYISSNNMDFPSYVLAIKLEGEKNFPELNEVTPQGRRSEGLPPVMEKKKNSTKENPISSKIKDDAPPKQSSFDPKAINSVSSYFTKLEERSKSPIAGFKKINQSLSRNKNSVIKKSVSPISRSKNNITKSMTSLKESKISPIFTNPPNLYPPPKNYEGRQINQNDSINAILHSITKSQGNRRFKTANFKGKSSLFENQHMQIGFKSEAVYEQVSGFKVMIKIELYFGNLCDDRINDLTLQFKGDQNILLYANPRTIESSITRGDQNKIDLIIIPIKVPFPMLTMTAKYSISGQSFDHKIIIPNSALKLAHFMSISKEEFNNRWLTSDILKTSQTKLCHYLPPDSFTKWIPQLGQLSSYTAFAAPGSKKDYELYCVVIMMQRYQSLLKINIRPNLQIVIQLGVQDRNEESTQYFTYFLQTLQQLLKEVS